MPRRKRLQPGQTYGSGRGGIDLGGLLMSIYGGVEANPEFNTLAGPTQSGIPLGSDPYKARTIFDRNEAKRLNADFRAGQAEEDFALTRAIRQAQEMLPIEGERSYLTNRGSLRAQREHETEMLPITEKKNELERQQQEMLAGISVLQKLDIIPTGADKELYIKKINPLLLNKVGQAALAATEESKTAGLQAATGGAIAKGTAEDEIAAALARSKFGRKLEEGRLEQFPTVFKSEMDLTRTRPQMAQAEMLRNRMVPTPPNGGAILDILTQKPIYRTPSEMEQAEALAEGKPITQPQQRDIGEITADDLIIDPVTKKILGVKPRR